MNRFFWAAALSCALIAPEARGASAPVSARWSLSEAVAQAVARSPAAGQAREDRRAAEARLSEARWSAFPSLEARASAVRGDNPVFAFSSLLEQRRFSAQDFAVDALNHPGYRTNLSGALELGVPLFTGFALSTRRSLSRSELAAAEAREDGVLQRTRERAAEAYLRLLLDRARLENADARASSAAAELEDARRLKARGLVLGSDYYAAQAILDGLRARRARVQGELAGARAAMATLLGSGAPEIEPAGSIEGADYSLPELEALAREALQQRPDLRQAAAGESASAAQARRERLSWLPTVEAFAAVESDSADLGAVAADRVIGARLSLPIGDPAYFARAERAAALRRAAREGRKAAEQAARAELERRWQECRTAAAEIPFLRAAAEEARRSLESCRPLYREGRLSVLDALRAEEAAGRSRDGLLEALFQEHRGFARLRLAAGRLDEAAIRDIQARLERAR